MSDKNAFDRDSGSATLPAVEFVDLLLMFLGVEGDSLVLGVDHIVKLDP